MVSWMAELTHLKQNPGATSSSNQQDMAAVFPPEKGRLPVIVESRSGWPSVTRDTSRGAGPSLAPLIRTIISWGLR